MGAKRCQLSAVACLSRQLSTPEAAHNQARPASERPFHVLLGKPIRKVKGGEAGAAADRVKQTAAAGLAVKPALLVNRAHALIMAGSFCTASKNCRTAFARSLTGYSHLHPCKSHQKVCITLVLRTTHVGWTVIPLAGLNVVGYIV
jgi:hypothetical protein